MGNCCCEQDYEYDYLHTKDGKNTLYPKMQQQPEVEKIPSIFVTKPISFNDLIEDLDKVDSLL